MGKRADGPASQPGSTTATEAVPLSDASPLAAASFTEGPANNLYGQRHERRPFVRFAIGDQQHRVFLSAFLLPFQKESQRLWISTVPCFCYASKEAPEARRALRPSASQSR